MIEKENKIIYEIDGKEIGVVEYEEINKTTVDIYHTYVDPEYQGRHIASDLMEKLFKKLKKENKKATASCSYAKHWMEKHPEYSDQFM